MTVIKKVRIKRVAQRGFRMYIKCSLPHYTGILADVIVYILKV